MLISQLFRGSPTLDQEGFELLQSWYMLTNNQKHDVILELADNLRNNMPGHQAKDKLKDAIRRHVSPASIAKLNY